MVAAIVGQELLAPPFVWADNSPDNNASRRGHMAIGEAAHPIRVQIVVGSSRRTPVLHLLSGP